MFNRGHNLETKRNEIIMACLSGGQHIDAALEAADRLVPQSEIDEAKAESRKLWEDARIDRPTPNTLYEPYEPTTSQPWYVSAVSKWLPF